MAGSLTRVLAAGSTAILAATALTALSAATSTARSVTQGPASTASAAAPAKPSFRMPFPCRQNWVANNTNSSAHVGEELDFNRGSSSTADRGDTVLAAAGGKVLTSTYSTSSGYGNFIVIGHGDGWQTYYAHLSTRAVKRGQTVSKGQPIGSVGDTSAEADITPHLHFEIRQGSGYPSNLRPVPGYNYGRGGDQTLTSRNCASRRDPAKLCGSGYVVNDSARLGRAGTVVLTWNGRKKNNCAVTLKLGNTDRRSEVGTYITPKGKPRKADSGRFFEFAGPVRTNSPSCVKWGGRIGGASYNSPSEHC